MRSGRVEGFVFCCALAVTGCGAGGGRPSEVDAGYERSGKLEPVGAERVGAPIVLGRLGKKNVAYVANADDSTLHTLDVDARRELAVTELRGAPSDVFLTRDGRLLVTFRQRSRLGVFAVGDPNRPLEPVTELKVPVEPVGLAASPDESTLLVTSGWGRALSAYAMHDLSPRWEVALEREPRAVIVTDDGKKAFVSHAVGGRVSVVSLSDPRAAPHVIRIASQPDSAELTRAAKSGQKPRIRIGLQNFALAKSAFPDGRILGPGVLADPGNIEQASSGYGDTALPHLASVAVIDARTERLLAASVDGSVPITTSLGWGERAPECLLPRGAVVDPKTGVLLVSCMGLGVVMAFDAGSADPSTAALGTWAVAEDPTGIALDPERRRALVWSQQRRTVNLLDLDQRFESDPSSERIELSHKARHETADLRLGRELFHRSGDRHISSDGRACASCHPDGRDDGLTWATPGGPRQTPPLSGRLEHTEPYGWNGLGTDLSTHLSHTFQRLQGAGLEERELAALIAYVDSLELPARSVRDSAAYRSQGERIFFSARAGCAGCHSGRTFTDGQLHDVSSRAKADADGRFNTPSLLGIAASAPYFHDGRFGSLTEMLVETNGRMGSTRHLSRSELGALIAYLGSL